MIVLFAALALSYITFLLWDAFETILLPRRVPSGFRPSRIVLRAMWAGWAACARRIGARNVREGFLGIYALLSLIALLVFWALGLVLGFAVLLWACHAIPAAVRGPWGFLGFLYFSGTTFFTLGLGDVVPANGLGRLIAVIEAGTGFGFLALVIAYIPVLYQAFSRREVRITMLDEWAGSPPTAATLLRRCFESRDPGMSINGLLKDWEQSAAEVLESHLSFPILAFFRSQHDNQSWLTALTAVLDTCALVIVGVEGVDPFQARLTFAICRHTLVDVSQNVRRPPLGSDADPTRTLAELREWLDPAGVRLARDPGAEEKLAALRGLYVPYARALADLLLVPLPGWLPSQRIRYNWETTAWAGTARDEAH